MSEPRNRHALAAALAMTVPFIKTPTGLAVPETAVQPAFDATRTEFRTEEELQAHLKAMTRYRMDWPTRVRIAGRLYRVRRPKDRPAEQLSQRDAERLHRAALKRLRKAESRKGRAVP